MMKLSSFRLLCAGIGGAMLLFSCRVDTTMKISGLVTYAVSSSAFAFADIIEFRDENQQLKTIENVPLPWTYSFSIVDKETYGMYLPWYKLTINADKNLSGGKLRTVCTFSRNFRNTDLETDYLAGVQIDQIADAQIYPQTF